MPEQISGKTSGEIREATRAELDSTHRVYVLEWLHVIHVESVEAAEAHIAAKMAGRFKPEHIRHVDGRRPGVDVQARTWNVRSEWKHVADADQHAAELRDQEGLEVEVVPRNGRREQELRDYGVKKLPSS